MVVPVKTEENAVGNDDEDFFRPDNVGSSSDAIVPDGVVSSSGGILPTPRGDEGDNSQEDDDDEVVLEMDVFMSPGLTNKIHLIQYPLLPYQQGSRLMRIPSQARYRSRNEMLELDYEVNHQHFATNQRSNGLPYGLDLKQRTYASTKVSHHTHSAMGMIRTNPDTNELEMHLIPIVHPILQMRPSFKHIDDLDDDINQSEREAEERKRKEEEEAAASKRPIQLKKKESERAVAIKQSSYEYYKNQIDSEEWMELDVANQMIDKKTWCDKAALPSSTTQRDIQLSRHTNDKAYVHSLNYLPKALEDADPFSLEGGGDNNGGDKENNDDEDDDDNDDEDDDDDNGDVKMSSGQLKNDDENTKERRSEARKEQRLRDLTSKVVAILLHKGGVPTPLSFFLQKYQHKTNVTIDELLQVLSGCSVLLRGNFVIKSSLCGLTPLGQNVRDTLMLLLNKYGYIQRYRLGNAFRRVLKKEANDDDDDDDDDDDINDYRMDKNQLLLSDEVLSDIVSKLCIKAKYGWICKMEDDNMFQLNYPQWTNLYEEYWESRRQTLQPFLEEYDASLNSKEEKDDEFMSS